MTKVFNGNQGSPEADGEEMSEREQEYAGDLILSHGFPLEP